MRTEAAALESTACRVTLSDFEGPLDLLLFLIRRDELDITLIQVSEVAGQYLSYIRNAVALNIDVAGEYLVMAATLTRLKSRSLLPSQRDQDQADDSQDPGKVLLRQLTLYRAFREAAAELRDSEETWRDAFPPPGERNRFQDAIREAERGGESGSILELLSALESLAHRDEPGLPHLIQRPVLSVSECIERFSQALHSKGVCESFIGILGENPTRQRVVSFFVAMLELVKRGWVASRQEGPFGGITLERTGRWA
ncbi:MAG: ScpA family protein [Candidatus Fermentibacteraceae bacterium]